MVSRIDQLILVVGRFPGGEPLSPPLNHGLDASVDAGEVWYSRFGSVPFDLRVQDFGDPLQPLFPVGLIRFEQVVEENAAKKSPFVLRVPRSVTLKARE